MYSYLLLRTLAYACGRHVSLACSSCAYYQLGAIHECVALLRSSARACELSFADAFCRAAKDLLELGPAGNEDLYTALYMMPVIYVILCLLRFVLTMAFRPLFIAIKGDMSFRECIFICAAGLRGSASLIMGSAVVTYQMHGNVQSFNVSGVAVQHLSTAGTCGGCLLPSVIARLVVLASPSAALLWLWRYWQGCTGRVYRHLKATPPCISCV